MNVYEPLDEALKAINRYNLREFGRLKLAPFDELHVIREVGDVYTASVSQVRKRLRKACDDMFWMYMAMCNLDTDKALEMETGAIPMKWIDDRMGEIDPVTRYRFTSETERKQARLMEAMTIRDGRDIEIDRALKSWTRQIGWFGIYVSDQAAMRAMKESNVHHVMWNAEQDGRQCGECDGMNGTVYEIDKVPPKPHNGCRCWLTPVD